MRTFHAVEACCLVWTIELALASGADVRGTEHASDAVPPQAAIDDVLKIPSIQSVHLVQLPPAGELPAWLQGLL